MRTPRPGRHELYRTKAHDTTSLLHVNATLSASVTEELGTEVRGRHSDSLSVYNHWLPRLMLSLVLAAAAAGTLSAASAPTEPFRVDHATWDCLLKEFVDQQHRVDYARLGAEGLQDLDSYIAQLAATDYEALPPGEHKALLINAYNAITIRWILDHYPVPSIWSTPSPFEEKRHTLGGELLSLDDIETLLRQTGDPHIHSALVCAARSCPPLRREAYVGTRVERQLEENTRQWLADPSLNRFSVAKREAEVSPIFKWYREDFTPHPGGLPGFLLAYAPAKVASALGSQPLKIDFNDYDWGLNDLSDVGEDYSMLQLILDKIKNWFR